jgi:heat-inducible transcriptional repressor
MDQRLNNLLRLVVEEFVASGEPVSSQTIVDHYKLDVSPATVRNWFAELDELGWLMQPHTSGGRVPTETGFKHYVATEVVARPAGKRVRERLKDAATTDGHRVKAVARELADLSGLAVIAALHESDTYYTGLSQLFAQSEFKNWQRVVSLTELLDHLDDTLGSLRHQQFTTPQIFLGKECPFGPACGAVVVTSSHGLVGILGPLRMDYQDAFSNLISALEALN